jgi:hypothetical protein
MARSLTTATLFSEHCNQPIMPKPSLDRTLFIVLLIAITIAVAIALSTNTADTGSGGGTGTLTGNVTIGPLCPVEPCTVTPDRLTAAYAARTIVVSMPGGAVIAEAVPAPYTGYSFILKPETYVVDISHQGIDRSPELPKTVTIRAGETIRLDISIDTGIR